MLVTEAAGVGGFDGNVDHRRGHRVPAESEALLTLPMNIRGAW